MVVNPRAIKAFGQALMQRAKTDLVDAEIILAFVERMALQPWQPPPCASLPRYCRCRQDCIRRSG